MRLQLASDSAPITRAAKAGVDRCNQCYVGCVHCCLFMIVSMFRRRMRLTGCALEYANMDRVKCSMPKGLELKTHQHTTPLDRVATLRILRIASVPSAYRTNSSRPPSKTG